MGLLALLPLIAAHHGGELRLPGVILLPLGLILLLTVQAVLGLIRYPGQAFLAVLYLAWGMLLMLAARSLLDRMGLSRLSALIAWALLIGGCLNTLAAVLQTWQIHSFLDAMVTNKAPGIPAYGNLSQSNQFADHQALALGSLLYLSATRRLHWGLGMTLGLGLLSGLALSSSKSSWLYLGTLAVLALLLHRKQGNAASRWLTYSSLVCLPLFFGIQEILASWAAVVTPNVRLASASGLGAREEIWAHAWSMFSHSPWLGVGYQNFAWENFLRVAAAPTSALQLQPYNNAHNLPIHLMAEFGLGGIALVLGGGYWLYRNMKSSLSIERWWLWSLLSILGIHSLLEFPLWYAHFWGPAAVLLAIVDDSSLPPRLRAQGLRVLSTLTSLLGIGLLGLWLHAYSSLEQAYQHRPQGPGHSDRQRLIGYLTDAQQARIFQPQIDVFFALLPVSLERPQEWPMMLQFNIQAMHTIAAPGYVYRQALLLSLVGEQAQAQAQLKLAMRAYPSYLPTFIGGLGHAATEHPSIRDLLHLASDAAGK
ncbi:PglL family O-oligosaccharyltransferase [Sulfuritortus calidifontis]|uniref:PglL family O-oligosaccharyltransferase n=1 Tax=Sulfuritortus calidifontis TaxID=1914471 RepID=UPI001559FDE3|nr:O-antigen ligase family protein [Sulfuritortus calidifontis]